MSNYFDKHKLSQEFKDYIIEDFYVNEIVIGQMYHLNWATSVGMVWKCYDKNDRGVAFLRTPKSNRIQVANINVLRATNRQASMNKFLRLKKEKRKMELEEKKAVTTQDILKEVSDVPNGPAPLPDVVPMGVNKHSLDKAKKRKWRLDEENKLRMLAAQFDHLNAYEIGAELEKRNDLPGRNARQIWNKIYQIRQADKEKERSHIKDHNDLRSIVESMQNFSTKRTLISPKTDFDEMVYQSSKENVIDEDFPKSASFMKKEEIGRKEEDRFRQTSMNRFSEEEAARKFNNPGQIGLFDKVKVNETMNYNASVPNVMYEFKDKPKQQTFADEELVVTNGKITLNSFVGEITASFVIKGNFVIERID